jgi:[protein-PII] uridylyltransferase
MRRYFLATKEVGDLVRRVAAAADPAAPDLSGGLVPVEEGGAIAIAGRAIAIASPARIRAAPIEVMRLFRLAQSRGLDVHPSAERIIAQRLAAIDGLRTDPEAGRVFLEILTSTQRPEAVLRRMSEVGVLGRLLPEFGHVIAQMQYDMVHVYTVDEHIIRAVGMLAAIERGDHAAELPLAAEIFPKIQSRRALYLAVFLHDIAKGRGGDHSETGAVLAREVARRLGLSPEEAETVAWLVQHHLLFSRTAFKRDVNDPQTAADLVAEVQSIERLRLLLLLTVADIRATSPALWNGWKGQLLRDLYWRAEEVITGGHVAERKAARVAEAKAALATALAGWSGPEVEAYIARHFPPYWLSFDTAAHARHAGLVRALDAGANGPAIDMRIDRFRDVTEVTVATPDRPGLFYRVAGAIAIAGASIADAKIYTLADGIALDTFWIQDRDRHAFADEARLDRLRGLIAGALADELDVEAELAKRRRPRFGPADPFPVEPRVMIDNAASTKYTVIEINGQDRVGLLYDVTRALSDLRLSIVTSRVSTYGNRAVDVFYVRDRFGFKVERAGAQRHVRERLLAALGGDRS